MSSRGRVTGRLMTAAGDTNIDNALRVTDYKHIILHLAFSDTSTMTASIRGAIGDTVPDFNSAQSATNRWDNIEVTDLEDGTSIDGDTGIAVVADDNRIIEINTNGLDFICPLITAYTAGQLDVYYTAFTNE